MSILLQDLAIRFGDLRIFSGLSLELPEDRVTAILGPSGCGKTTLLNLLSGTLSADSGEIEGVAGRKIGYLFQEPRLLPWISVKGNIELVLKRLMGPKERDAVTETVLKEVGLQPFRGHLPDMLSGGMRQRVAMARAFAYPSDLLLMDEPFQALDLLLKLQLVDTFRRTWRTHQRTSIFVTHDIHEALILGDSIIVIGGRPATVRLRVENDIPPMERSLQHPRTLSLEKQLYDSLLSIKMI